MFVHAGIGLNVLNDTPTTCLQQILTSQGQEEPSPAEISPLTLEETAAEVVNNLEELLLVCESLRGVA